MMNLVVEVNCFYYDGEEDHAYLLQSDIDMENYGMEEQDFIKELYKIDFAKEEEAEKLVMWHVKKIFDICELDYKKAEAICWRVWNEDHSVCYFDTDFSFKIENKDILEDELYKQWAIKNGIIDYDTLEEVYLDSIDDEDIDFDFEVIEE